MALRVTLDPLGIALERAGSPLIGPIELEAVDGSARDQLIVPTEGVLPHEELGDPEPVAEAAVEGADAERIALAAQLRSGRELRVELSLPERGRALLELEASPAPLRLVARWPRALERERFTGLGARHGTELDQRGRRIQLGADRSYTGPDCPPDMLQEGGIAQGDYAPAPWLLSSGGYAVWLETYGPGAVFDLRDGVSVSTRSAAGPLRVHLLADSTPVANLRRYLRLTGLPALLPEWGYGHWKSRDVYEHQRDVVEDFDGYRRHQLPLDAIVIDSPWETQYNTWEFNPNQFPDPRGMIERFRAAGVRTVVWVTPWVNLDSSDGQRPPDAESERMHSRPAANYGEGVAGGHFVRSAAGDPYVGRWWMGRGSIVDFTSPGAERWWRRMARRALDLGVQGIKADDGEGYYVPADVRFADGRTGAEAAWAYGELYRRSMQAALDEAHPGSGVLFGRSGWTGQQAIGMLWGGDQASDFWSLRTLVAGLLGAAASGFSNLSHDVGGYLGRRLVDRCPAELLARWVQFGCFSPLMQAHGRFRQEAWTYDHATLEIYRRYVLLHERLVPYIRAAAATAARSGLPIMRPLPLIDPGDEHGWAVADGYGFGPALWIAPVLDDGARSRSVYLPRGDWIDFWTGERARGGRMIDAAAPLDRIPAWVRSGSILVTYPGKDVAAGLGEERPGRPLEATLWGTPRSGRALARLADGTRVRWTRGRWSVSPPHPLSTRER